MLTFTHEIRKARVVFKKLFIVPLIVALSAAPALARPTVIAELGASPLLGTSTSTAQMRARVAHNEGIMSAAAAKIGLTTGEYAQFRAAIDSSRVAWVTVPRHLDAMTWQSGGTVYALHDVVIPAGTHGWEVDVPSHGHILALYMPAKCGNLSLVRKSAPVVAVRHPARVAALKVVPPVAAAPLPVAAPPADIPDDTPAPVPATVAVADFPPAVATHRPFFLAPLLFGLAALAGNGGGPTQAAPLPPPVPGTCP